MLNRYIASSHHELISYKKLKYKKDIDGELLFKLETIRIAFVRNASMVDSNFGH